VCQCVSVSVFHCVTVSVCHRDTVSLCNQMLFVMGMAGLAFWCVNYFGTVSVSLCHCVTTQAAAFPQSFRAPTVQSPSHDCS